MQHHVRIQTEPIHGRQRPFRVHHAIWEYSRTGHRNDPRQPRMPSVPGPLESRH
jgi:hypothetical protein